MAEETENLVLEHLRALRRETQDGFAQMNQRMDRMNQRMDRLETELRGLSYIVSTAVGAVLADMEDLKERVGALEERAERPT